MAGNFIVNLENTPPTTNETSILYIVNSLTNTHKLFDVSLTGTSLESGTTVTFRVYVNPTVSNNGTSLLPLSKNFADGNTSSMNIYSTPTVTSKGVHITTFSVLTSSSYLPDTTNWTLINGNSFLITAQTNSGNKGLSLNLSWGE